ncbi:MAG: hypothetical protein PSX36_09855 [bacterium]|nr:hypothetical protein [bacterium]
MIPHADILLEPEEEEEEIQKPDIHHDVSLWLDHYDDIFSDFDLRPFSSRNISDDFLREVKNLSLETNFQINELKLFLPAKYRNAETEAIVTKRLHSHFRKNQHYFAERKRIDRKRDWLFIIVGGTMMVSATAISSAGLKDLWTSFLLMIFEPGGWFLVWVGMEHLIHISQKEKPELDFYTKMIKTKINFLNK